MTSRIIIIGAGIAGLTAGILLKQQGHSVSIYEKRSHISPLGGGLGLWPNGSKVLLNLPCAEAIQALAVNVETECFGDEEGNTLAQVPREVFNAVNQYPVLNICRSDLHQILLDAFGKENIYFNKECLDIKSEENFEKIYFQDLSHESADLVIGADGIFSNIRKNLFPEKKLQYSGYITLVGIIHKDHSVKNNFVYGENRYSLVFPISKGRHLFYIARPFEKNKLKSINSNSEKIKLFKGWSNEVEELLEKFEESLDIPGQSLHFYCGETYYLPPLKTWHKNRTVLIGDAAHPMGSIMAFGSNNALEDVAVLTHSLKTFANIDLAIDHYEQEQIPRIADFLAMENHRTQFLVGASKEEYVNYLKNELFHETEKLIQVLKRR